MILYSLYMPSSWPKVLETNSQQLPKALFVGLFFFVDCFDSPPSTCVDEFLVLRPLAPRLPFVTLKPPPLSLPPFLLLVAMPPLAPYVKLISIHLLKIFAMYNLVNQPSPS